MKGEDRTAGEAEVREFTDSRDFDRATTLALSLYGREILEFLCGLQRSEADASEVFSLFAEALWRGLPDFSWHSSLRTWAYAIARNVSLRYRRDAKRRARRFVGMPDDLAELAERLRSQTQSYLRTAHRTKLSALRQKLSEEDQMLLLLRVQRRLAWEDLARVFADSQGTANDNLAREAARLRKRFQLVKERLAKLARAEGLVS